jgi:O-antigen ligase
MLDLIQPSDATWLNGLAEKDRFGDRIHLAIASGLLLTLPLNSAVAGTFFGLLVLWYLVRLFYWKPYILSGPMWVLLPGVVWVAYLAISLWWSPDRDFGYRVVFANRWILLVPMLWPLMTRWRVLLLAALVGCLIQSGAQIVESTLDWDARNASGLNDHPRPVAAWMAAGAVGVVTLYLSGILRRWVWLLAILPIFVALILTGSRGATAATAIGIIVVAAVLLAARAMPPKRLGVGMVCLVLIAAFAGIFHDRIQPQMVHAYDAATAAARGEPITDIRLVWWRSCLRQWENHPMFGYGVGGTADAMESDAQLPVDASALPERLQENLVFNQPHSTYLQVLVEGGIVGIALLALLLGSIVAICLRTARLHPLGVLGLGTVVVWMITAAFDAWHSQGQPLALLWTGAIFGAINPSCTHEESGER